MNKHMDTYMYIHTLVLIAAFITKNKKQSMFLKSG